LLKQTDDSEVRIAFFFITTTTTTTTTTVTTSESSVYVNETTWHYIPEGCQQHDDCTFF
jgi:GTP cyclohydrolase III